jgi:uridine phosphorylase
MARSLSSRRVTHLHPTAELAPRALLPDDPGQALALARLLFDAPPLMFNHHRGLWGYSGVAADGAALTIQSTGIGGPSAVVVVAELQALGLRRAIRVGRAWSLGTLATGVVVAASEVLAADGASRALGAGTWIGPDADLLAALADDADGCLPAASADLVSAGPAMERAGARLFDLESAAVLAAARHHGVRAATLVVTVAGDVDPEDPDAERMIERLGRLALSALAPDGD